MEKKQGGGGGGGHRGVFFSALKSEVVWGLSPSRSHPPRGPSLSSSSGSCRSRSASPKSLLRRRHSATHAAVPEMLSASRLVSGIVEVPLALLQLNEGPDQDGYIAGADGGEIRWRGRRQMSCSSSQREGSGSSSDLGLLLGVPGALLAECTLAASRGSSIKNTPMQYTAASGGYKLQSSIHNTYAMGKVRIVAFELETANKWYVELALCESNKVHAGCNWKVVWRHTHWLGAQAAKGPVRPLRRTLQAQDASGRRTINGEDCFILKPCADPVTLKARSEGPAEIIRHGLFRHFSQKTAFLVHLEGSHLIRIQNRGGDTVYWEKTINSFLEDQRPVEGIMIAHSGRSVVTLFRFGETAMSHTKTRMEEAWNIKEVAFNVPGHSVDCFIPSAEIRLSETCEYQHDQKLRNVAAVGHRAEVTSHGLAPMSSFHDPTFMTLE